ncbi:MAG: CAP domain-containing protein [Bacteroidia bacterium]
MSFRTSLAIASAFFCHALFSQRPTDKINPAAINYSLIDKLFNEHLSELRKSKSLTALASDAVLKKAAQDQADYMNANDTLTHSQPSAEKKNPSQRVLFYGGQHDGVGENCLFDFLFTTTISKNKKDTSFINTYADAAAAFFKSWKNSPGHYKNMIEPKYDVQGIAFSYNPSTKKIYASQVFGMAPYAYDKRLQGLLSSQGIKPYSQGYCQILKDENVEGIRLANRIVQGEGKVYFSLQNTRSFLRAMKDPNDMIAIDIVFKDQFTCEKNNRLNGSPYFDGVLLKPVRIQDLLKRNEGTNGRIYSYVCDLPAEIKGMNYQLNVVLIKAGCFCSYTYPQPVESEMYDLINLQPFWDTVRTTLKTDTFNLTIREKVLFGKGKSDIDSASLLHTQMQLLFLGQFTKSIKLNAYSSVEGDEKINKSIQEKRANVILNELKPFIPATIKPEISATENWDLFMKQVMSTKYYWLYALPKPEIKKELKDSLAKPLEKILKEERYSEFEVKIEGAYYDSSRADILRLGLMKALNKKDLKLAHEIQSKMIYQYLHEKASLNQLSGYDFPDDTTGVPFVINLLAAKCINPNEPDHYDKRKMKEMFRKYSWNKHAKYNFCIYAINYWALEQDTIVQPEQLLKMVNDCKKLAPESAVNSMLLNYYLAAVKYYDNLNDLDKMGENLENIYSLFKSVKLDENTSYKLALYFSDFNMTHWATELLEPYMTTTRDEKVMHLYLAAGSIHYHSDFPKVYTDALDRYIQMFPAGYKNWIKESYQMLREDIFKTRYCNK